MLQSVYPGSPPGGVHILDVGCGDGRLAGLYFEQGGQGFWKGIDLSERAIGLANLLNARFSERAVFAAEDVTAVSGDEGRYDCATLIEVLEHIPDENISGFLQGVSRKLKAGGKLFITVPSVNIPVQKKHYRHYTPELLRRQVEQAHCGLTVSEVRYIMPQKRLYRWHCAFTMNRFWQLHITRLDTWMFNRMMHDIEQDTGNGMRVFACVTKQEAAQ